MAKSISQVPPIPIEELKETPDSISDEVPELTEFQQFQIKLKEILSGNPETSDSANSGYFLNLIIEFLSTDRRDQLKFLLDVFSTYNIVSSVRFDLFKDTSKIQIIVQQLTELSKILDNISDDSQLNEDLQNIIMLLSIGMLVSNQISKQSKQYQAKQRKLNLMAMEVSCYLSY